MVLIAIAVTFIGFAIYGLLAPLKVHFSTSLRPADYANANTDLSAKPFVGLALSGGGARAAVFAAAGMQELAKLGLLQDVTHVSSVSGGGFPASYFAINPMPEQPGDAQARYFRDMLDVVARDYFRVIHKNQITNPSRLMSPSRRLVSLQQALQQAGFLNCGADATVQDLPGDRAFYFNAVSYDTGRRFVIGNHALPHPDNTTASRLPGAIRALSFSDAATNRPAPAHFPISLAVATSAAFPPYLGPLTIKVTPDSGTEYWHLGDGGVLENPGVETLREAFYATDQTSGRIYAFDAGQRLAPRFTDLDISIFSRDLVQFIDVILEYATGHRTTLYDALDEKFSLDLQTISFDYLNVERHLQNGDFGKDDANLWSNWDLWPDIGLSTRSRADTPAARLQQVPTGFSISADDQRLIEQAARTLVARFVASID